MELKGMLVLLFLCILQCTRSEGATPLKFRVTSDTVANGKSGAAIVTSVLVTEYGQLLMADYQRDEIKMVSLKQPNKILSTFAASGNPDSLLQLLDGRVMISFRHAKKLVILNVDGDRLTENATLTTERKYSGLARGYNGTVIASSAKDGGNHGRVDVLDLQGKVLRTLLDDTPDSLPSVYYLRRYGDDLYLSDHQANKIMMLSIQTGSVKDATFGSLSLSSLNLEHPRDMWFDNNRNMYVSVVRSKLCNYCVIQINQAGEAKALSGVVASMGAYPYGVTTTSTLIIVSWWHHDNNGSEVTAYQLPN